MQEILNIPLVSAQTADIAALQEYFSHPQVQVQYLPFFIAALLLLALLLYFGIRIFRWGLGRQKYIPRGSVDTQSEIHELFDSLIVRRTKMEFRFASSAAQTSFISCMPVDLKGEVLTLECSKQSLPVSALQPGRELVFYFSYRQNHEVLQYSFEAELLQFRVIGDKFIEMDINLPKILVPGQKRGFLRIEPAAELILGMGIWPPKENESGHSEALVKNWGRPVFTYLNEETNQFVLHDISSNGAQISILKEFVGRSDFALTSSSKLVLKLELWDPAHQLALPIWLMSRVQKASYDYQTGHLVLGIQFMAWAKPMEENPDVLRWVNLSGAEEVPPLGDWIIQRYLEVYREKSPSHALNDR